MLAFVGYGWILGSCLQEGSAAHSTLCVSLAQALGCFAIQANPFSLLLLATERSENLQSQRAHVLYQLACPWGLAYACMVVAASFICLLHGEPPFAVDVWVLLSATRGDCQQPKGGKCGTCGTGTRGSELCSICSPDMGAQRTNFCCEP